MREKIMYIADDGTEFVDEQLCQQYEAREWFKSWYQAHPLLGADDQAVPILHLADWLKKNRESVLDVLRGLR